MAKNINASNISSIRLAEQGSDPSTPASGFGSLYAKADGLYFIGDDGVVEGPLFKSIGARVYNSGNISLTNETPAQLTFDSERYDTDNMHSTSVNPSRLTFNTAGKYMVGASARFATNATGVRLIILFLNGTTSIGAQWVQAVNSGSSSTDITLSTVYDFAVSDYLEMRCSQASGDALNVLANGNSSPEFWAQRIG